MVRYYKGYFYFSFFFRDREIKIEMGERGIERDIYREVVFVLYGFMVNFG